MTLNNENLRLLTKFALRAKKHIGAVKVVEMFNNEEYAFNMLTQATLTGDVKLVDLTKKISYEFEIGTNLVNAIESYINNIEEINSGGEFLQQSKLILFKLVYQLYGIKINGASYRQAVERLLLNVDSNEKTFSINLARKFYSYWRSSNSTIAENNNDETLITDQKNSLIKLWENLDQEFFSNNEILPLSLYAEYLRENRNPEKDISISVKIAKIITLEIRNGQKNSNISYRDAIDKTRILFESEELKQLFIIVSREYYNFWLGIIPKSWSVL